MVSACVFLQWRDGKVENHNNQIEIIYTLVFITKGITRSMNDYIIVGSGIAGLYTAQLAAQHNLKVVLVTKEAVEECNTRYAQGGIAAAIGEHDSPELHIEDTLVAGAGISDPAAVRVLCEEGPARVHELINLGVPFDTHNGAIALTREAAHSERRILHAGGDATGAAIETTLAGVVANTNVDVRAWTFSHRNYAGKRPSGWSAHA